MSSRLGLFSSTLGSGLGFAPPAALHLPLTVEDAVVAPRKSSAGVAASSTPTPLAGTKRPREGGAAAAPGSKKQKPSKEAVSKFSKRLGRAIKHALYPYYTATLDKVGGPGALEVPPETLGLQSAPVSVGMRRPKACVTAPPAALLSSAEEFKAVAKKAYDKLLAKYTAEANGKAGEGAGSKKKCKGGASSGSGRLHFSRSKHGPAVEAWVRQYLSERALAKGAAIDWKAVQVLSTGASGSGAGKKVAAAGGARAAAAPLAAVPEEGAAAAAGEGGGAGEGNDDDDRSSVSSLAVSEDEDGGSDHDSIFGGGSSDEEGKDEE